MPKQRYLEAGQIVGTHGVRGEVRVKPECDSPEVLAGLHTLYWGEGRPISIHARVHKSLALVKLEGVDTVEAAAALRGRMLYLDREDIPLEPGRYFIRDLIGMRVVDDAADTFYGTCTDVSHTGANDVYHVRTVAGTEVLIPVIPSVVRSVDVENDVIRIVPMRGLFDDED